MKQLTTLYHGDCLKVLQQIGAESVDSIVTDPPYGLEFMGKDWDNGVPGKHFWEAALRVAKPGAHLLAFGGTRMFHRLAVAIEDAGWEIRDTVMWVYGSGFPKSHNLDEDWKGWGTALKPAWEPIIVARKPLIGTVAENVLAHGTGAINVDGCRVGTEGGEKRSGTSFDVRNWQSEKLDAGRWPANLIHDGSEEVTELFPMSSTTGKRTAQSKAAIVSGTSWGTDNHESTEYTDSGSAARFFYCAKASKADRDEGCDGLPIVTHQSGMGGAMPIDDDGKDRDRFKARSRNHHPTVKPTDLMRYLCRLVTPPNGIVLDPFMGSGSTGKAAVLEGFDFVGIEQELQYLQIASARIQNVNV